MKAIATFLNAAALLLAGCAFPVKDNVPLAGMNTLTVTRDANGKYTAAPPDCDKLPHPSQFNAAQSPRPDIAFGCATYTNLAAQIANPKDLARPAPYAGQHADTAGAAVTRYRAGKVEDLNSTSSTRKAGASAQ
jgi:type IV pilus biogenesis protein CpaD/CtpE